MAIVERNGSSVDLYAADSYGEESEHLTPEEAREIARQLTDVARQIEADQAAVRDRCEREGHDWDGYDAWSPDMRKIHMEYCRRDLCDARRQSDGWRKEAE